jgi:hypothetical protein
LPRRETLRLISLRCWIKAYQKISRRCAFTPDDPARLNPSLRDKNDPDFEQVPTPQARPNVIFETGMAFALHPTRTILVQIGHLRPFSDIRRPSRPAF